MQCPFPGMDPYLEHPALWPGPHNSLIVAIAHAIAPRIAPRDYAALGHRPYDVTDDPADSLGRPPSDSMGARIIDRVNETFVEVREVGTDRLVTVVEVLSPATKGDAEGRRSYEASRRKILESATNFVEIDLLRDGESMEAVGETVRTDYSILVRRGGPRPRSTLTTFGVRAAIPTFPLPLREGEDDVPVDLNAILHALYERAHYDLRLDYARPAVPPLSDADAAWSRGLVGG